MPSKLSTDPGNIRANVRNNAFRWSVISLSVILPLSLIAIAVFLTFYAWPAIQFNGLGFLFHNDWDLGRTYGNPVVENGHLVLPGASYGILFLIVGTLFSSLIAIVFALPLGIFSAIFIAEGLRGPLKEAASFLVELLAAVPSVVYGLFGYIVLIPFLGHYVYPFLTHTVGRFIPYFGGESGSGYGLLTAGIILALMIVPLISATLRDALSATPRALRESGISMGASRMEVVMRILLPRNRTVLVGATILALGRALGETMAILMVSGNALNVLPSNLYSTISTMASFIVSQLDSALQDPTGMAVKSLAEVGLVLMLISIVVNAAARALLSLTNKRVTT